MAKDYASIAKEIVEKIGGVDNISGVTHCMTRLRFVLKDDQKVEADGGAIRGVSHDFAPSGD